MAVCVLMLSIFLLSARVFIHHRAFLLRSSACANLLSIHWFGCAHLLSEWYQTTMHSNKNSKNVGQCMSIQMESSYILVMLCCCQIWISIYTAIERCSNGVFNSNVIWNPMHYFVFPLIYAIEQCCSIVHCTHLLLVSGVLSRYIDGWWFMCQSGESYHCCQHSGMHAMLTAQHCLHHLASFFILFMSCLCICMCVLWSSCVCQQLEVYREQPEWITIVLRQVKAMCKRMHGHKVSK